MRGVVNIEFIISVFIFLVTVAFILISTAGSLVPLHRDAAADVLRARAYQISEVVIFDGGDPADWDVGRVNRIGLSAGEKYIVSSAKIERLQELCSRDYERFIEMLSGNAKTRIGINITGPFGSNLLECGAVNSPQFSLKRFAVLESGEIVEIEISVRQ